MNDTENLVPVLELVPAYDNVWYWLATLNGEQNGEIDKELAERNRASWLRWFAPPRYSKPYAALEEMGFSHSELIPFNQTERQELLADYARHLGCEPLSQPSPNEPVNFCNTHFERNVSFRGFLFDRPTDFSGAKFSGKSEFEEATFSEYVYFSRTKFTEVARFIKTTFSMRADFIAANFSSLATFHKAMFSEIANFQDVSFSQQAYFQRTKFVGEAWFHKAKFSKSADFINAEFCSKTVFDGATFTAKVPDFRGAKLHEATEWHEVSWPKPGVDEKYQDQVYAYERLRQEMERLKKPEDEQFFARKEFRAKRGLVKSWSGEWLLNCSYEFLSDYGHSIARPLAALLLLFLVGVLIFSLSPVLAGTSPTICNAAAISFTNILSIFPGVGKIMLAEQTITLSGVCRLFAVVQIIFGALLLFLLGLALRNRFRMR